MHQMPIKTGAFTIKEIMHDKGIKVNELAKMMTSRGFNIDSNILSSKLHRDTFTLNEYIIIADILDCDVKTISRITNKEYINEFDEEKQKLKNKNNAKEKGKKQ